MKKIGFHNVSTNVEVNNTATKNNKVIKSRDGEIGIRDGLKIR